MKYSETKVPATIKDCAPIAKWKPRNTKPKELKSAKKNKRKNGSNERSGWLLLVIRKLLQVKVKRALIRSKICMEYSTAFLVSVQEEGKLRVKVEPKLI